MFIFHLTPHHQRMQPPSQYVSIVYLQSQNFPRAAPRFCATLSSNIHPFAPPKQINQVGEDVPVDAEPGTGRGNRAVLLPAGGNRDRWQQWDGPLESTDLAHTAGTWLRRIAIAHAHQRFPQAHLPEKER